MKIILNFIIILYIFLFYDIPVFAEIFTTVPNQFVDILNQKIRIHQVGYGQTVLLIHGLPGCIEDWETIMPKLSKRFHVIAYDRPGHGLSSANDLKYNLDHNVNIAFALIHKLKLNNPIIVGHSYGGSIVLAMAVRNTPNIKAFISVSPITSTERKPNLLFKILKIPLIGPTLRFFMKLCGQNIIKKGMNIAFDPNQKNMPNDFIEKRCMIISLPNNIVTAAREEMAICQDLLNLTPLYGNIKKPFFIIHGESDKVVHFNDVIALHENVPGSKLILFKETGHMVQYARPTELMKVIEEVSD